MARMDDEIYHAANRGDLETLREWRPHVLEDMMERSYLIMDGVDVDINRYMLQELADMMMTIDTALANKGA